MLIVLLQFTAVGATEGLHINDLEKIDSDIVSDHGMIKIKDSKNENFSSAIDKGELK